MPPPKVPHSPHEDPFDEPFEATVNGPVVVVTGLDAVAVSMTPEAVLDSLDKLRAAAEAALRNRALGIKADVGD